MRFPGRNHTAHVTSQADTDLDLLRNITIVLIFLFPPWVRGFLPGTRSAKSEARAERKGQTTEPLMCQLRDWESGIWAKSSFFLKPDIQHEAHSSGEMGADLPALQAAVQTIFESSRK